MEQNGITAATWAGSCTVLKVMSAETYVEGRGLERTVQSTIDQCTGGARRIDRRSYVKRHVRGVDADVLIVLIHPWRDNKCLATEVVHEEGAPGW